MYFGLPNGVSVGLETFCWTLFVMFVGLLGEDQLAATTIAFTLNLIAFFPAVGIGQAVEVLVGQHLGADLPDLAERSTYHGLWVGMLYCALIVVLYLIVPDPLAELFRSTQNPQSWEQVRPLVPPLLRFVSLYCIFDGMNLVFSFALRGAGDTRFVTAVALALAGPIMVLPTLVVCLQQMHLFWPWTFASVYVLVLTVIYFLRFRQGRWKSMRVIEAKADNREVAAAGHLAVD
jgi:MATE family multidrug resistance protein